MVKRITCIGCEDDSPEGRFISCMVCSMSGNPGQCTEYRQRYGMSIVIKVLLWSVIFNGRNSSRKCHGNWYY